MVKLIIPAPLFVPAFIVRFCVWLLLVYRKKRCGVAFRKIKLTKRQYAIVDPDDYHKLARFDWYSFETANKNYYAFRLDNRKIIYMHRQIMNAPKGKIVDHKDGNALNNTKQNLRFATHSQNTCNSRRPKKGSSKYRGVCWNKCHKKWRADIYYNGIYKHLGYFDNEEDAARAYDNAAKIYHREFAVLNFPDESHQDPKTQSLLKI